MTEGLTYTTMPGVDACTVQVYVNIGGLAEDFNLGERVFKPSTCCSKCLSRVYTVQYIHSQILILRLLS